LLDFPTIADKFIFFAFLRLLPLSNSWLPSYGNPIITGAKGDLCQETIEVWAVLSAGIYPVLLQKPAGFSIGKVVLKR
jgi:hypothetical protein